MASHGCHAGPALGIVIRQTPHNGPSCQVAYTTAICAKPGANPTTSFTWRGMSPRPWLGVGLDAVCADVVESLNAILEHAYNGHTTRGGGMPGASALQREAEVVLQAWG